MLKLYILFCAFLGNALICYFNTEEWNNPYLFLSFMINLICILIGFHQSLSYPRLNLDTIIWVFVYMFFFLAPVIQIDIGTVFPNSLPIQAGEVVRANLIIFVWNFVFLLFRSRKRKLVPLETVDVGNRSLHFIGKKVKVIYFLLSLLVSLATLALFKQSFFLGLADYGAIVSNKSILLLLNISVQGIVFGNWIFALDSWKAGKSIKVLGYLAASSVMMLNQISPFNTSRFYLGFCIIMIIYLFYFKTMRPSQFVWIIFSGLLLVFPFFNYFRYGLSGFEMPSPYHLMFDQLTELHFDAFSNLIASLQYCDEYGITFGYQLLGVLFFFVPRDLWAGKPLSSGEAVGDYISENYALQMTNLSNPIPSEFYINFGWIGVVVGAIFIAWLVSKLEKGAGMSRYTHSLIAGYLFIIYRGDMMNAFAYCFGTYVVIVLIPLFISKKSGKQPKSAKIRGTNEWMTRSPPARWGEGNF